MKSILNYNHLNMKLDQKRNTKDAYVCTRITEDGKYTRM